MSDAPPPPVVSAQVVQASDSDEDALPGDVKATLAAIAADLDHIEFVPFFLSSTYASFPQSLFCFPLCNNRKQLDGACSPATARAAQARVRAHQQRLDRVCDALDTAVPACVSRLQAAVTRTLRQLRACTHAAPKHPRSSSSSSKAPENEDEDEEDARVARLVAALAIPREHVRIDTDAPLLGASARTRVHVAVCAREPVAAKCWALGRALTPGEAAVLRRRLACTAAAAARSPHVLAPRGHTCDGAGQPVCIAQLARAALPAAWPRTVPAAAAVLAAVAAALAALHVQRIAHANLKPANVLCDAAGTWRVADAWLRPPFVDPAAPPDAAAAPTPATVYTAPEVLAGAVADPLRHGPGDVYAFGVLAHELLFGPVRVPAPAAVPTVRAFVAHLAAHGGAPAPLPVGSSTSSSSSSSSSSNVLVAEAAALVRDCWAAPEQRPTATQLCARVARLHEACVLPEPAPAAFWHRHFAATVPAGALCDRVAWAAVVGALARDCAAAGVPPCDPAALAALRSVLVEEPCESSNAHGGDGGDVTVAQWRQGYLWFGEWFAPGEGMRRAQVAQLFGAPWFHGAIGRAEAAERLGRAGTAPGTFLVRLSTTRADAPCTLDHRTPAGAVASVRIACNAARTAYRAPGTPEGPSVAHVVAALCARLRLGTPCPRALPPDGYTSLAPAGQHP